jgi:predicted nucleic acid-binding protein
VICVDASVVAKRLFTSEVRAAEALALLTDAIQRPEAIIAPPLLPFEVTNIVRQRMIRDNLRPVAAHRLITQFLELPVTIVASPGLHQDALTLADTHQLPAAYDAHYLALAQNFGCDFWTDDRRLLRLVGSALPFVRALDTYPAP